MANDKLHPSVEQFKRFVKNNPRILEEVKNGRSTLQELFEEWFVLGEDDSRWDVFRSENNEKMNGDEKKEDWSQRLLGAIKNMDSSQMQQYIGNISQALGAIQGVLGQFQSGAAAAPSKPTKEKTNHPFVFRKD